MEATKPGLNRAGASKEEDLVRDHVICYSFLITHARHKFNRKTPQELQHICRYTCWYPAIKSSFHPTSHNITFLVAPLSKGKGKANAVDEEIDEEFD